MKRTEYASNGGSGRKVHKREQSKGDDMTGNKYVAYISLYRTKAFSFQADNDEQALSIGKSCMDTLLRNHGFTLMLPSRVSSNKISDGEDCCSEFLSVFKEQDSRLRPIPGGSNVQPNGKAQTDNKLSGRNYGQHKQNRIRS